MTDSTVAKETPQMDDQRIDNVDVCHVLWKVKMDGVRVQDVLKEYHSLDLNLYWRLLQIHLKKNLLDRISSISIGSSNVQPSESPYLHVLFIGTSQSKQHDKSESDNDYLKNKSSNNTFPLVSNINVLGPGVLDIISAECNGTAIVTIQGNLIEDKAVVYKL
ncbi:hypothetical protein Tco_0566997 [Tanacetum coccineum]